MISEDVIFKPWFLVWLDLYDGVAQALLRLSPSVFGPHILRTKAVKKKAKQTEKQTHTLPGWAVW